MESFKWKFDRRTFLTSLGALGLSTTFGLGRASATSKTILTKPIPATGEALPVIGMGSWITFNVGANRKLRDKRVKVLQTFFDEGGGLIDSSPMYGSSEDVIGYCLKRISNKASLFSATKVWTVSKRLGIRQMEASQKLWDEDRFDLMQIHNLLDWKNHLETLKTWKTQGRVRYIGITTSHGRRHDELEKIMMEQPIDFVQFTYNIVDREAEKRLLPLAKKRRIAVIINRPFQRGVLFDRFASKTLPGWAGEFNCKNWAQFFLKFVISHPAVTCAIPATSQVEHMRENMGAAYGRLPDKNMRKRMIQYIENL